MEWLVLGLFVLGLVLCVIFHFSVVWALAAGYFFFFSYGLWRRIPAGELWQSSVRGLKTVRTILMVMVLIGMLTTVWRAGGTISMIVSLAGNLIRPELFFVLTFVLNCCVSCLTGTAFGTAATMGVICMSVANFLGASPVWTGGAIMSGAFFGDRCSPLSTSALLVAAVTHTDFFRNLAIMARRAVVPFILSCMVYGLAGWHSGSSGGMGLEVWHVFASAFQLHWLTLIPAVLIIACSLMRMDVRKTMGLSIITACVLAVTLQGMAVTDLLPMLLTGYRCPETALAPLLDGGGILSMISSIAIIGLSATYAGLFERTGLLLGLRHSVMLLRKWLNPFGCIWVVSFFISMISCAQTLAVILTDQICQDLVQDKERMMMGLEDTVIVSAALIPWCIAAAVPLAAVSAPVSSLAAAVYLYVQPLWSWRRWK